MTDNLLDFSVDARIMVTDERITKEQRDNLVPLARKVAADNFRDIVLECDVRQACVILS